MTKSPRYDTEASWKLLTTCNYRCDYCFLEPGLLGAKVQVTAQPDQWAKALDATDRRWLIHITGGEPSIYPRFVDLIGALTRKHVISFNTNLTHSSLDRMIGAVDPDHVLYIHASVHPRERLARSSLDPFVARARRLAQAGFPVLVSMVIDPESLAHWQSTKDALGEAGLALVPKIFRGQMGGKRYPGAYSRSTRLWIREELEHCSQAYSSLFESMGEHPTIDIFEDAEYLDKGFRSGRLRRNPFRGKLCAAGSDFVSIAANGEVYRCGTKRSLGNLLRGDVVFLDDPESCDNRYCEYFCRKYTSEKFTGVAQKGNPVKAIFASLKTKATV